MLTHAFPEESAARLREQPSHITAGSGIEGTDLPVFVMAPLLPEEQIRLNIFEPRYRLMVRRCMEGNKRMGMTCAVTVRVPGHLYQFSSLVCFALAEACCNNVL